LLSTKINIGGWMNGFAQRVVRGDDVEPELERLGLTPAFVREVAERAAAARAEATPLDPVGTAGLRSYQMGTRAIRERLLPLGWIMAHDGNVESTVNHELGIQLIFQNVGLACGPADPEAISGKGAASRKLINAGQGELFSSTDSVVVLGTVPTVWLVCVSADEQTLRAEVSCPASFEGAQFNGFQRRLIVVEDLLTDRPLPRRTDVDVGVPDELLDVPVIKKVT